MVAVVILLYNDNGLQCRVQQHEHKVIERKKIRQSMHNLKMVLDYARPQNGSNEE